LSELKAAGKNGTTDFPLTEKKSSDLLTVVLVYIHICLEHIYFLKKKKIESLDSFFQLRTSLEAFKKS